MSDGGWFRMSGHRMGLQPWGGGWLLRKHLGGGAAEWRSGVTSRVLKPCKKCFAGFWAQSLSGTSDAHPALRVMRLRPGEPQPATLFRNPSSHPGLGAQPGMRHWGQDRQPKSAGVFPLRIFSWFLMFCEQLDVLCCQLYWKREGGLPTSPCVVPTTSVGRGL